MVVLFIKEKKKSIRFDISEKDFYRFEKMAEKAGLSKTALFLMWLNNRIPKEAPTETYFEVMNDLYKIHYMVLDIEGEGESEKMVKDCIRKLMKLHNPVKGGG